MKTPHAFTDKERALLHAKGFVKLQGSVGDYWKFQDLSKYDAATQIGETYELIVCVYLRNGDKIFKATRYKSQDTKEAHSCRKSKHKGKASKGLEAFLNKHLNTQ